MTEQEKTKTHTSANKRNSAIAFDHWEPQTTHLRFSITASSNSNIHKHSRPLFPLELSSGEAELMVWVWPLINHSWWLTADGLWPCFTPCCQSEGAQVSRPHRCDLRPTLLAFHPAANSRSLISAQNQNALVWTPDPLCSKPQPLLYF